MTISTDLAERTIHGVRRFCEAAGVETDLLAGVAARVKPVVGWDTGVLFTTDPATTLFTDACVDGFDVDTCTPWFHHEINVDDVNLFRDLAGTGQVALLSRSCGDPVADSTRHREVMRPLGLDAEVRLTADDASGTWGAIEVHRERGARDFGDDELRLLAALGPVVATGIRQQALARACLEGAGVSAPGLIHLSHDGEVRPGTEAGAAWLELLAPGEEQDVHSALLTMAALLHGPGDVTSLRARTADGRWVTLHASRAYGGDDAVVIVEPAGPADVADLLARAHGLSPREREVALGLARGESTATLAQRLGVSPHTVRDHLKNVFRKTGTTSRTELVSHLFSQWYAERLFHP